MKLSYNFFLLSLHVSYILLITQKGQPFLIHQRALLPLRCSDIVKGWFGQRQHIQGTLCPRNAISRKFPSGTHWSRTNLLTVAPWWGNIFTSKIFFWHFILRMHELLVYGILQAHMFSIFFKVKSKDLLFFYCTGVSTQIRRQQKNWALPYMKLFTYLPLSCFSSLCVAGTNRGMQADETGWLSPQRKELTKGSPELVQS